ncbi:hypothetical protein [Actinoplanes sp. NPDC051859]|uniref:hypothetical protein n=1 Tax=Actinoplanes sp. NPDC051859 TaxID=3363909 RepID=UPI0037B8DD2D
MARFTARPSRRLAILIAVLTPLLLIFGIVQVLRGGGPVWFLVLWLAAGAFIVAAALRRVLKSGG